MSSLSTNNNQPQQQRLNLINSMQPIEPQTLNNNQPFQHFHQHSLGQNTNNVTFQFPNQPHSRFINNQPTN